MATINENYEMLIIARPHRGAKIIWFNRKKLWWMAGCMGGAPLRWKYETREYPTSGKTLPNKIDKLVTFISC
jgi:hypothetical protein